MKSTMEIWEYCSKTDPKHTKNAKLGGRMITAICPQFQRKAATKLFGPMGIGFGVINEEWMFKEVGDTLLAHYSAIFWYKYDGERGEFPISSNIKVSYMATSYKDDTKYIKLDDEYAKKAQTDALTKGLSMLGFNSDIFEGLYDDNKYVQQIRDEFSDDKKPVIPAKKSGFTPIAPAKKEELTKNLDKTSLILEITNYVKDKNLDSLISGGLAKKGYESLDDLSPEELEKWLAHMKKTFK